MKNLRLAFYFLTLIYWIPAHAATLTAKVDPTQIMPGQAFHLILELDENAPAGLPDFSPLHYDFQINGTAHRASYMFIDGQSKASSSWTVTLTPKHTGKLTIPAIQVGHARSAPTSIEVTDSPQTSSEPINTAPATALFIQTSASDSQPYINQQVIYTVKIFHNTSILDALYQPPQLSDALTMPLGENRQYQVIENGRPYLVEEQKYAFFPQQGGAHKIYAPSFQALIYDDIPRRVRADGTAKSLDIKPIPENFKNKPWVPAKSLALTEHYDKQDTHFEEGSTLVRTLTLRAAGLPAELLPPLDMSKSRAFNSYPERPVLKTEAQGSDIIGKTTVKISYLFNQPGQVTLPAQTVTWFNTETGKTERSTLPERILHIAARTGVQPKTPPPVITTPEEPAKNITAPKAHKLTFKHALVFHAGLLCLFLLTVFCGFLKYLNYKHTRLLKHRAFKALKKACLNHQPRASRDALFVWAKLTWPNNSLLTLDDIAQCASNPKLAEQLKILSAALYDPTSSEAWNGQALLTALRKLNQKPMRRTKKSSEAGQKDNLPPINPKH
ncbi:MAG: BatD family protein [Legionellaceae bacterium]|nr:BatD family protein [Legionellaceae bacterium]